MEDIICTNYKFFVFSDQVFYLESVYYNGYYTQIGKTHIVGYLEYKINNIYKLYNLKYYNTECKDVVEIRDKYKECGILYT